MKATLAMVVAVVLLLAGCGSNAAPHMPAAPEPDLSAQATPIPHATTFTTRGPRFSVTYDASRLAVTVDPASRRVSSVGRLLTVVFSYKDQGTMVVHARRVPIPGVVSPPPIADMRATLSGGDDLGGQVPALTLHEHLTRTKVGAVQAVTLNGLSGYRVTYAWDTGRSVYYVLFKGRYVYSIEMSAITKLWPSLWPTFNAALHSLLVLP